MSTSHAPRAIALIGREQDSATLHDLQRCLQIAARERQGLSLQVISGRVDPHTFQGLSGAIVVVTSTDGIGDELVETWDACDDIGLPRLIVLTDIDSPTAEVESTIEECQEALGDLVPVLAVDLPILGDDDRPIGLIDLITGEIVDYSPGHPIRSASEQRHRELIRDERTWLIEAVIAETEDDRLVEEFLSGGTVDEQAIAREFYATVARGRLHPICVTAPTPQGLGIDVIVDIIERGFPASPFVAP